MDTTKTKFEFPSFKVGEACLTSKRMGIWNFSFKKMSWGKLDGKPSLLVIVDRSVWSNIKCFCVLILY